MTNVGIVKGARKEFDKKIIVSSPQTLHNQLHKFKPDHFDCVIIDESHFYMAKTFMKCANYFDPKLLLGLTATPFRLDGLSLHCIFDKIVHEYPIDVAIKDGYLAPLNAIKIETHISLQGVRKTGGDFAPGELSNKVNIFSRNAMIVQRYLKHAKGKQAIAFCTGMKHCADLKEHFDNNGISCDILVSDKSLTPDRIETVRKFKAKETTVLINIDIATVGFDYEDVGVLLMARPTTSKGLYMQMIGRGTRLKSVSFEEFFKTKECIVLDFVDNTGNHTLINTFELDKGKKAKDKIFVNEEKREKLDAIERAREAEIKTKVDHETKIDLLKLPEVHAWNTARNADDATEPQIKFMQALGVWEEGVLYTKQMAAEAITNTPASYGQKAMLKKWGYDSTNATLGQFKAIQTKIKERDKYKVKS